MVTWCGAISPARERVCRLHFLLVLASAAILGSESRGTHDHIILTQVRDSPNLEAQVSVFISPRNRVAQLYPQALGSLFVASYYSRGYGGGIRTRLHAGLVTEHFIHYNEQIVEFIPLWCSLWRDENIYWLEYWINSTFFEAVFQSYAQWHQCTRLFIQKRLWKYLVF
jgi:hypothetical protein